MLKELKEKMSSCRDCALCNSRTQIVFDGGNEKAKILIIGEGPGEEEDLTGKPFVGKAGQKLDKIFQFIGLTRNDVYITNSVICRPPNNRVPTFQELQACRWRLLKEIELVDPKLIIVLGKTALQQILGKEIKEPLKNYFNNKNFLEVELNYKKYDLFVQFHPSFLIRNKIQGYQQSLPYWTFLKDKIKCLV